MRRLIVSREAVSGDIIYITDKEDITYLSVVLRMKEGDKLLVSDGEGGAWETSIRNVSRSGIELIKLSENPAREEEKTRVTLYQGLPKGAKMDEIIRKATELGVYKIVPVGTGRSLPGSVNMAATKLERWRRIAKEASKQSMRIRVPDVSGLSGFEEAASGLIGAGFDLVLVPYELEEGLTLKQALKEFSASKSVNAGKPSSVAVFIGPEGGFEQAEVERLVSAGAVSVTMGDTILRTETAGPAAVAMILYELS